MKTNVELRGTLTMVLARLDADPKTVEEWDAIREALDEAARYAAKCRALRWKLLASQAEATRHPVEECDVPSCSCHLHLPGLR